MLETLRISNYAIIDQVELDLSSGFTAITGETGAGKSIVLGALRLLLGGRASSDVVRAGAARATAEGIFGGIAAHVAAWLVESGFELDEGDTSLLVRREILASGSSRNYISNCSATLAQLRELGALLVDLHGQNDHTSLLNPQRQLDIVDSYGGHQDELSRYRLAFDSWARARREYLSLTEDQGDAERRKAFLEFQVEEIRAAELVPGEDQQLESERKRLINAQRLGEICALVCDSLYEGERAEVTAVSLASTAAKALAELAALDPTQTGLAGEAESLRFAIEDLAAKVRQYADETSVDPERLTLVDDRLELIKSLKRKYGSSIEDVVRVGEELEAELSKILNHDEALAAAEKALRKAVKEVRAAAAKLSAARNEAAADFEKKVQAVARDLELPTAVFKVGVSSEMPADDDLKAAFGTLGVDACEFLATLNNGEDAKPLRKVASGGEISRVMLAIKSVMARKDNVPTLIFDEIDTGISGEAAARVGEKLQLLAKSHQVLVITHLPQVAARGDQHVLVEKISEKDRTSTRVSYVENEARREALARMLSGRKLDEESLRYAEKLLSKTR